MSSLGRVDSKVCGVTSPWTIRERIGMLLWEWVWITLCIWTPKPWNRWRLFFLKLFGATVEGVPFVHQRARIQVPWNVSLGNGSCIGDRTNLYSLGKIEIKAGAVVAQEAYLCSGTHDFSDSSLPLITKGILVEANVFIGARVFVMPGVTVGEGAIVGACSVVTRDVVAGTVNGGNPCRIFRRRNDYEVLERKSL